MLSNTQFVVLDRMYQFELLPQSWSKRRTVTEIILKVVSFEVFDFEKVERHTCTMRVVFDNADTELLNAWVYVNRTHTIEPDGSVSEKDTRWGVQGTNPHGVSVVLRLLE